ncbi:MAG: hypothetical protein ACI91T_002818 [Natronomonas sp.]|jgi:hypothetical protein
MGPESSPPGVTLPESVLSRYRRFTLYNSPYAAHDRGHAIDLYPGTDDAPSPVAGEVLDVRTYRAPPKDYATEHDHLILIDPDDDSPGNPSGTVARVLHVDPAVEPGDRVDVGDPLGTLVRTGFFAPWVDNHLHLGFRDPGEDLYRASGSLPLAIDVEVEPLPWDGTGTIVDRDDTYVVLDAPAHPAPGDRFAGIAADDGGVIDGGVCHYEGGGILGTDGRDGPVSLLGARIGLADGRDLAWEDVAVYANDHRVAGLSLFLARDGDFGAKLIAPDNGFAVGDDIAVSIRPTDDPTVFS